jgi:hypothetical protein
LICTQCYALLAGTTTDATTTTLDRETLERMEAEAAATHRTGRLPSSLAPGEIGLYIRGNQNPLIVQLGQQAVLGRQASEASSQPRIDLTPYGAFDKGVSRMHAVIRRDEKLGLTVEDLASSNGTWLNGLRLQPYVPNALHTGDILKLSQIEIVFTAGESARLGSE